MLTKCSRLLIANSRCSNLHKLLHTSPKYFSGKAITTKECSISSEATIFCSENDYYECKICFLKQHNKIVLSTIKKLTWVVDGAE